MNKNPHFSYILQFFVTLLQRFVCYNTVQALSAGITMRQAPQESA